MKIIIFGATGNIGKQLVKQAIEKGYQVTAFSRNPEKIDYQHENLSKIKGDVLDFKSVESAVKGHSVVFCSLGAGRKGVVRSEGTKNIILAMQNKKIDRVICQTTLGNGNSWKNLNWFWKYVMFSFFLKEAFRDHELQEQHVMRSGLEWTLVRPGAFTQGALRRKYRHGFEENDRSITLKISCSDVAHFMLEELEERRYLRKATGLSY